MLGMKNLVIVNMANALDWEQGIVNRNFFIARELSRSGLFDNILLVDFLAINPVGLVFGKRRTAKYALQTLLTKRQGKTIRRFGATHVLRSYQPKGWGASTKLYLFGGLGYPGNYKRSLAAVRDAMQHLGFTPENTMLWSYQAFAPDVFDLPAKQKVFDAVDNWAQHASYKAYAKRLADDYTQIGKRADTIFTVSDGLRALFPKGKAYWIPNGVDLDVFERGAKAVRPSDIPGEDAPIIGYVGTVQERIDFELVRYVLQSFPKAQFIFVGPVWSGVQKQVDDLTSSFANIRFLGRRPYESIPAYLSAMDAAIIPHRIDDFIQSTNPMKLYDYLAAGKSVVTTPGAGTEAFASVVQIADSAEAFREALMAAVYENDETDKRLRREAIIPHTWEGRLADMRRHLVMLS